MASGIVEPSKSGSSSVDKDSDRGGSQQVPRARLVQKLLAAGSDLPAFLQELIRTQGIMVAGTEAAAFVIEPGQEQNQFGLRPIAHERPDDSAPEVRAKALEAFAEIVKPCVEQGKDGVIEVDTTRKETVDPQFCLVTLLRSENQVVAVSAVIARAPNLQRAQQRLSSMELVAGYFEMFTLRRAVEQSRQLAVTNQNVLQLATSVATAEGYDAASMSLCNELAARTGATRVAIGWVVGNKIKLKAMSHTEKFDKKQELAVMIVAAMEECWDQDELVQYEPDGQSSENVTRASAELSRTQGGVGVLSLPLRRTGEVVGVITLEFNPQKKIGPHAATSLSVAVELLAPQLYDRYENDRYWITKTGLSTVWLGEQVFRSKKHMLAKLIIALVLIGLVFTILYRPMYHVTAPFSFAVTNKQIVSAPFEGFVGDKVMKKPGDMVKKGDVLLEMQNYELRQRWTSALSNAQAKRFEAQNLLSDPNKSAQRLQSFKEAEAYQAEADLYNKQIQDSIIKAPIDGVILSGDWKNKKNAPVRKGDELFKIGDTNTVRIEMSIAERDIQSIRIPDPNSPQYGFLATSSLPTEKTKFRVEQIIPLPTPEQGGNVFKVYGIPETPNDQWREGMQGEARVQVEKKPLIWIWTHRVVDWVRIKLWV